MKKTLVSARSGGWMWWLAAAVGLCTPFRGWADPDLPGAVPNLEVIPAGSYIIPMDTNHQAVGVSVFNMKAYGLVNALLHANVPVKWAITTGKAKDGMDFAAYVRLLSPTNLVPANPATASIAFYSGPFIVDNVYTNLARPIIRTYGNNVAVYTVMSNVTADIRHTLTHKPMVAVFDDGGTQAIQTDILDEAGFPASHYKVLHAVTLGFIGTTSCFTFASSPHFDGGSSAGPQASSVREFVDSGGNFLAQCRAVGTYENQTNGHFHATAGFADKNDASSFVYPNPDMAFNQFQGTLFDEGGSLQDWGLAAGSAFTNSAYIVVRNAAATNSFRAGVSKLYSGSIGGLVFYLGGHTYAGTSLGDINGRRLYMNAVLVPADRPGVCGITFTVDLELTKTASTPQTQVGSNVTFTVVVTNKGPANATGVNIRDLLPAGMSFVSASGGAYTPSNGIWSIGTLSLGSSASLQITATATQYGSITNIAQVWTVLQGDPDSTPGNSVPAEDDQGQAVVTVEAADLSLTKRVDRAFVHQGSNLTFTVVVTNGGVNNATGVTVRDALPAGAAYVSSSGGLYNPASGIWTIGTLNAGSSTSLQIIVTAVTSGSITNGAEVQTAVQHDPDSTPGNANPAEDDYGSVTFTSVAPDYVLAKTVASPAGRPAAVGETVVFAISVTNTGNVALDAVRLDDTYDPVFLTFLSGTPPPMPAGGGSLTWSNTGPLAVGASLTVTARFMAVSSTLPGVTTNTVASTVTLTNGVPVSGQTASALGKLVVPGVAVAKALVFPTGRPAAVGETNIFTVTVSNTGNYPLDTVPVVDTYDTALLAFVGAIPPPVDSIDDGTLNWTNVGPLAPGGSTVITGRFSAARSGAGTNLVVSAPTTTNNVPVPPSTNSAPHAAADAALLVAKRVLSPAGRPAAIGETVSFLITVTNTGAVPVYTVPLSDTFNTGLLAFASASPAQTSLSGNTLSWANVGPLGIGAGTAVTAAFTALTNGVGTNFVVTLTSTNNVPHTNVNPRVSITKTLVSPTGRPAAVGEEVLFSITAQNRGDVTLDVVPVTDAYDETLLSFVSALPASDDTVNDGVLEWANIGPLTPGSGATITAGFRAAGSGTGTNVVVTAPSMTNGVPVPPSTSSVPHVTVSPGVLLTKRIISPLSRPVLVGEEIVFGLTVTNTGDIRLDSVPLVDTFDTNLLSAVSQTPAASSTNLPPGTLIWTNVGPLAAGGGVTVTTRFVARVSGAGVNVVVTAPSTTNHVPVVPSTSSVPHTAVAVGFVVAKQISSPTGRPAVVGEEFVFTLLMINQGEVAFDTVSLADNFDTNLLQIVSQSPPANSANPVTGTLSWTNVGPVAIGGQVIVTARFKALASGTGTNVAIWSPATTNALPITPSTSSVPHTAVKPGFTSFKTLITPVGRPAAVGEPVSFRIIVTNTGDIALGTIKLDDTYDLSVLDFDSSTPQVSVSSGNQLTWDNVGPLAVGGSMVVTGKFTALASTLPGVTTNTVIATVTEVHGVPVGSETNVATAQVVAPAVALAKTLVFPAGRPSAVGETNVFTITVSNTGDYPLDTVPVADTYDTSLLAFVGSVPAPANNGSDGTLNWTNVGPLAVGASAVITSRFSAVKSGTGTNLVVSAPSTTNGVPVPPGTNGAPHTAKAPGVGIAKSQVIPLGGGTAQVGEAVVFRIAVTNTGDVALDTVPVTDTYETAFLSYIGAAPPSVDNLNDGVINWTNVGPLAPGASADLFVTFAAKAGTDFQRATNTVVARPTTTNGVPVPPQTGRATYLIDESIDVDNVSTGAFQFVTSGSVTHTVLGNSSNRLLVAGISVNNTPEARGAPTNVMYGALPMTLAGFRTNDDKVVSMWVLKNPPAGTTNVVARFNRAPGEGWVVGVITFRNVDQTVPYGEFLSSVGTLGNVTLTSISSALGEVIVDAVALQSTSLTATGTGQTQRWMRNSAPIPPGFTTGGGSTRAGAASVDMSWTAAFSDSGKWAMCALALRPHRTVSSGQSEVQASVVQSSHNPSAFGEPVSFTATITGSGPVPTGTVQFRIDGTNFGSAVAMAGGTAVSAVTSELEEGIHIVTAAYSGDVNYLDSVSPGFVQTVGAAATLVITAIHIQDGRAVIEWPGTATWFYTVNTTTSLYPLVAWSNLLDYVDLPGVDAAMSATDTNVLSGARFYRVKMAK